MLYGYYGKDQHIGLIQGKLSAEKQEKPFFNNFLSGSAMSMHYTFIERAGAYLPAQTIGRNKWITSY